MYLEYIQDTLLMLLSIANSCSATEFQVELDFRNSLTFVSWKSSAYSKSLILKISLHAYAMDL